MQTLTLSMLSIVFLQLTVVARDSGIPPMSAKVNVKVNVARNLHAPTFEKSLYNVSVAETLPRTSLVLTPKLDDQDGVRLHVMLARRRYMLSNVANLQRSTDAHTTINHTDCLCC